MRKVHILMKSPTLAAIIKHTPISYAILNLISSRQELERQTTRHMEGDVTMH